MDINEVIEILLAEDNLINQKLIISTFNDPGYNIDVADNGNIVIEKIKAKNYDIILMDFMMPEMDGLETTVKIRNMGINIPIIGLSAYDDKEEIRKFLNSGMNDFIIKPVNKNAIISLINKYITKKDINNVKYNEINVGNNKFSFMNKMNNNMKMEFINDFLDYIPKQFNMISKFMEEKKYSELASITHKFKGSFFSLGTKELNNTLNQIELKANEKNNDEFHILINNLDYEINNIIEEINEYVKSLS